MEKTFTWPQCVEDCFPAIMVFYKPRKAAIRKGVTIGYNSRKGPGGRGVAIKKPFRNRHTHQQNNYSIVTSLALSPNDWGTIARSLKHKGYSKLVTLAYATDEEIAAEQNYWRYRFRKYKTFDELYRVRGFYNNEWLDICNRLEQMYPCHCSGQIRLF